MEKKKIKDKKNVFKGKLLQLLEVRVQEGEDILLRECIEHPGAVGVLPVLSDGSILFVQQYRPAVDRITLELPAGLKEQGERPLETAKRELLEETGYEAEDFEYLLTFYPSFGYSNEELVLYLAKNLLKKTTVSEEGLTYLFYKEEEVHSMLASGAIKDSKTLLALYHYFLNKK